MPQRDEGEKLRRKAEAQLQVRAVDTLPVETDQARLVHELQVHQIELEMQNTALRHAQAELETSRNRYVDLYEFAPIGYITLSHDARITAINLTGAKLLGEVRWKILQQNFTHFLAPASQDSWHLSFQPMLRAAWQQSVELVMLRADGAEFDAHLDCLPITSDADSPILRVALTDISARKHAEKKLQLAANVFTHTREGIMITTAAGKIIEVNQAFTQITGYSRDEVLGQSPHILNSGRHEKAFYDTMWQTLVETGHWCGEIWNRRKNGELYAEMQTISAVRDAKGEVQQYVALLSDITELKEHERKLEHIAHFDALTGLPNRVLLADRMHQAMTQTERRGMQLAVVYLDLDGFKAINDQHGHAAGDQLLATLASRMKSTLREGDTLARLGGDEFVAVLIELPNSETSKPTLTRLLAAAAEPVQIDSLSLRVSASAGVTFYPQAEAVDADQLLRQADQAMYQAKLAGKNRCHVFDAIQDRSLRGHHESMERIRQALVQGEFVLYYQPKVNMRTGAVIGAEALIRWQHPQNGLLLPAVFLPVIEDHPIAVELGEWVINRALTQMEVWQAAGFDTVVSVNVGAGQLQQKDFVDRLRSLLAAHPGITPDHLELEVLETSALEDLAPVVQIIDACRKIGVMFALDDFGTGYSSLTYLKRLAVAQLKIDQSFVRDMLDDPDDLAILEGVLGLAAAFRRQVLAEGVETVEHGELLLLLGCELAQGFGIARPMPADQLPAWSRTWQPDARWLDVPTLGRDDLPMLYACVEHRAWIAAIDKTLNYDAGPLPQMDHHQCRFGIWLDSEKLAGHGAHPAFLTIDALHRELHALGAELLQLQTSGRTSEALARLNELHALRDSELELINTRLRRNGGRRKNYRSRFE
jgi:diguanylate cyclase (GGDEF)-like protein/PAS domain S-box-containing protein